MSKQPPPRPARADAPPPPKPVRASADAVRTANTVASLLTNTGAPVVQSSWTGSREGAIQTGSERDAISTPPQRTTGRRQGSEDRPGDNRSGPIRQQGEGWVYAPSTSHISRFMLVLSELKTQNSVLQVVFKGPEGKGEVAEYAYHFSDPRQAQSVFDAMRRSGHPYGEVLTPKVIRAGIPYHPLARS